MRAKSGREATMRTDIEFKAEDGVTLRGWRYRPADGSGPWPTIVMAHGFSAVKEMYLGERIGVWGSSYSGAHVLVLGAIDRRIACVASQVPLISGYRNARRLIRADMIGPVLAMCAEDRLKRYRGEPPALLPVVSEDPAGPAALPTPDSWHWFTETGRRRAPSWRNEVTLRSVELFLGYEPGAYIELISPTPLLMVVALGDHLTVADEALGAYERARQPKRLVTLKGGHFDAYVADFDAASGAARDWFVEHLTG
jgi:fermentation-respiration switch protein FrsA (DUF1100 family)